MRPYESLIIFDAELEEPAIAAVLDRATELVRSGGGERGPIDRWGKRTFAYEMRHKREGYYVVMEYTAEPPVAAEIDRVLHLADEVLRHKTIRMPDNIKAKAAPVAKAPALRLRSQRLRHPSRRHPSRRLRSRQTWRRPMTAIRWLTLRKRIEQERDESIQWQMATRSCW